MPIRAELRRLYPPHWQALSRRVRFERAGGRCQGCGRPHLARVRCLPDGRWFDEATGTWRDRRGRPSRWPDLIDAGQFRVTRVVLAAAHLDNDPANNRLSNLRSLCQRCHMLHDRPHHRAQRWLTYRRRWAVGDLFLGGYESPAIPLVWFPLFHVMPGRVLHRSYKEQDRRPATSAGNFDKREGRSAQLLLLPVVRLVQ